ncbi:DUF4145 domain-containing protein [Lacticaseibacillus paracasei]|uniref:DUF4145 domain-containing protein n=1 Tax=Lacticaseibacillus paracasei TaxID=1597 RepID=UPI0022EC4254|nr:DUF4145 domain-containing protein [Lacticaseibacillus paracasei]WBT00347.1 DUF4145 domain-containing protein [Lacticaseibacillus paracasei]
MRNLHRNLRWDGAKITAASFTCANCGRDINSDYGMALLSVEDALPNKSWYANIHEIGENYLGIGVYICTNCGFPTFLGADESMQIFQIPKNLYGSEVSGVADSVNEIYNEARRSFGAEAYTGVVELCRSLLNHVAVDLGAKKGQRFIDYVNYLNDNHFISVKSRVWVDKIRKLGNEANHDLTIFVQKDAELCLRFVEMILKSNYEYPSFLDEDE